MVVMMMMMVCEAGALQAAFQARISHPHTLSHLPLPSTSRVINPGGADPPLPKIPAGQGPGRGGGSSPGSVSRGGGRMGTGPCPTGQVRPGDAFIVCGSC